MKFSEMQYKRPNIQQAAEDVQRMTAEIATIKEENGLLKLYYEFCALEDEVSTAGTIASIRHTVDTHDEFYSAENDYFDELTPVFADKTLEFYREVLKSQFKKVLASAHGDILLEKMEIAVKSSDERLVEMQQEENALTTLYEKLYASARIPFMGKEFTVAQLAPYKQDVNRDIRKAAFEAEGSFFDENREELDGIYGRLVKNRTRQARTLGFESFTPLGDIRMERHGYTREDIKVCRDAVAAYIVPVVQKLKQKQAARIGVNDLRYYDDILSFADGNAKPKGSAEEILAAGQKMYRLLSRQTAEFIDFMMGGELFDVLAKPGKAPGGYCTYIPGYKSPFIFSNFNGTSADVDVLTHEAGHAFAAHVAAAKNLPLELRNPGLESCEIHSMSMEFLTEEYHHLFFGEDTKKYAIAHTEDALFFLPYGCLVDEFQETVYNNPLLTSEERNALWLKLEQKYRPWNNFEGLPFYSRGAGWQRQLHIYVSPFYYIDYVLAQAVALQFFAAHNKNKQDSWQRYLALVSKAGTETYKGLVHAAGMKTPFEEGAMREIAKETYEWLKVNS